MLFSRTAVHGIYVVCYLNREKSGYPLSSPAVAAALGIPRYQAAKVLQSLSHAGLVHSSRGRRGGYRLVKQLNDISVIEVLDALNPPEGDERLRPKTCKRDMGHLCSAHRGLKRLHESLRQALVGETLAGLTETVWSDLNTSGRESPAELVCINSRR